MKWDEKPAISFQYDPNSMSKSYWPMDDMLTKWNAKQNDDDKLISIHYTTLLHMVKQIYIHFISLLQTVDSNSKHLYDHDGNSLQNKSQPIIAISIPEGPYLPLAVFVVHMLNIAGANPDPNDNRESCRFNAIMMPLDPEDGIDRIQHMILDAKPNFILCCDGEHQENIIKAIGSLHSKSKYSLRSNTNRNIMHPIQIPNVEILNFASIVNEALMSPPNPINDSYISFDSHIDLYLSSHHSYNDNHPYKDIISHIVYTSGTTGVPKGCVSSLSSLMNYIPAKNYAHGITKQQNSNENSNKNSNENSKPKRILLASSLPFDPCLSDILATFYAKSTLVLSSKVQIQTNLKNLLIRLRVTHVLSTPTLWGTINVTSSLSLSEQLPFLEVIALGGEPIPKRIVSLWARQRQKYIVRQKRKTIEDQEPKINVKTNLLRNGSSNTMTGKVGIKLMTTYGVTEACVYQTMGEIFHEIVNHECHNHSDQHADIDIFQNSGIGQDVGIPLAGSIIRICKERIPKELQSRHHSSKFNEMEAIKKDVKKDNKTTFKTNCEIENHLCIENETGIGEIVISGSQVDAWSGYLNLPELTKEKFVQVSSAKECSLLKVTDNDMSTCFFYRTGDRGYINPVNGHLHILGRINGEEGMIKVNGVRIELGEIEAGIVDYNTNSLPGSDNVNNSTIIERAIVTVKSKSDDGRKQLTAYIVLSENCRNEIGISFETIDKQNREKKEHMYIQGILCTPGPLLTLLYERGLRRIRKGCTPSAFILIDKIPLTSTGKCNRKVLPPTTSCVSLSTSICASVGKKYSTLLQEYGKSGFLVSKELIRCLNIQKSQLNLLTTEANFAVLGGDSLAATLVTRSLYAAHHEILNSRHLGGSTGTLDGPFNVKHLLSASTLREYVDFLDNAGVCQPQKNQDKGDYDAEEFQKKQMMAPESDPADYLYDSLMEAITLKQTNIALGLLELGVDPNHGEHGNRLGKTRDRNERRKKFRSNPLHIACLHGNATLVDALIQRGCNCNSPDANGSFPIHLACIGNNKTTSKSDLATTKSTKIDELDEQLQCDEKLNEDLQRTKCIQSLLDSGKVPLTMKDGSKQTILHSGARSGHRKLLNFLLKTWREDTNIREFKAWGNKFDWQDRWFRTPVHWAVLNGNVEALQLLLKYGCDANPPRPRKGVSDRSTSAGIESPSQICQRLYGIESGIGKIIWDMLNNPLDFDQQVYAK